MRRVVVGVPDLSHCDNQVRNTRYTPLSFVPLLLREQFSQWLNLYFLGLACLQLVPGLSPTSPLATWVPLLLIVGAAGVREALDDAARGRRDRQFNRAHGAIRVGQVVAVREGETVPCDGLLLGTADTVCFCETQLLDGETDWKEKQAVAGLREGDAVEVAGPTASPELEGRAADGRALSGANLLPQGAVLRGCPRAELLALFTGRETRASLSRGPLRGKRTRLDRDLDRSVLLVFAAQLALAVAVGVAAAAAAPVEEALYLALQRPWDAFPPLYALRFVLLFSLFIPVSAQVTVVLAKYILSARGLERGRANHTGLVDELGRVEVVCADKTGTLTRNVLSVAELWPGEAGDEAALLRALCLCSAVSVLPGGRGFQAASPDERALVEEAARRGVLLRARRGELVELQVGEELETYRVLEVLPFSSARRRMAVLVEGPLPSGRLAVLSKGADEVQCSRCGPDGPGAAAAALRLARQGLRTLVVARREVDRGAAAAAGLLQGGARAGPQQLEVAFESLERRGACLGVAALRDELQEGAATAVAGLRAAGLRVWCLTGDKAETALSVAASCGLWEAGAAVREWDGEGWPPGQEGEEQEGGPLHLAGRAAEAMGPRLQAALLAAPAVLCSRCSPQHKALLVAFLRSRGRCVLAVGDGGNDVAMIQEADVGVGLAGREGTQAALAADFALEQFADLRRLVLWDGRHALQRVAFVGLFCFYKSGLLALGQAAFATVSLFSGSSLFSSSQLLLYNVLFTSAPLLSRLADRAPVFAVPRWNRALLGWLLRAAVQAALLFAAAVLAAGADCELNMLALPVYCGTVLVATWTLTLEAHSCSGWLLLACLAVPPLLLAAVLLLASLPWTREFGARPGAQQLLAALLGVVLCLLPFAARRAWLLLRAGSRVSKIEILKVVVVGGPAAGKTALIQRHQTGVFLKQHRPSASPDFSLVHWDEGTQVHLWDVPSAESATGRTPIWYEGARGFLVVADVSQSVNAAADWLTDVRKRMPATVPVVLLLNKRDLAGGTASARAAVEHFARSEGVAAFFETSALEGIGFAEALKHLVGLMKKKPEK